MQVGIRDLKNKLSHYLEIVKSGHTVIITDRGAPVAVLHNLDRIEENAGSEERLAHLAAQGFLALPKEGGRACRPVPRGIAPLKRAKVKGAPVSDTIIRERR